MKKRWIVPLVILALVVVLFFIRLVNPIELDDVTPGIPCEKELFEKADTLWVIPDFENHPISENKSWCEEILALNKTIEMHGITHSYREFTGNETLEDLQNGMEIFKECFGFYPTRFKPPQLAINEENKKIIEGSGMELVALENQITHKVYHCNDSDIIKNKFIDIL